MSDTFDNERRMQLIDAIALRNNVEKEDNVFVFKSVEQAKKFISECNAVGLRMPEIPENLLGRPRLNALTVSVPALPKPLCYVAMIDGKLKIIEESEFKNHNTAQACFGSEQVRNFAESALNAVLRK